MGFPSRLARLFRVHIMRLLAPTVLIVAGLGKLLDHEAFALSIAKTSRMLGLSSISPAVFYLLPVLEIGLAVGILSSRGALFRCLSYAAFLLALVFVAVRARFLVAGVHFSCACFGELPAAFSLSMTGLLVALSLAGLLLVLVLCGDPLELTQLQRDRGERCAGG